MGNLFKKAKKSLFSSYSSTSTHIFGSVLILLVVVLLFFQNCSEVNLLGGSRSDNSSTTTTEPPSPSPSPSPLPSLPPPTPAPPVTINAELPVGGDLGGALHMNPTSDGGILLLFGSLSFNSSPADPTYNPNRPPNYLVKISNQGQFEWIRNLTEMLDPNNESNISFMVAAQTNSGYMVVGTKNVGTTANPTYQTIALLLDPQGLKQIPINNESNPKVIFNTGNFTFDDLKQLPNENQFVLSGTYSGNLSSRQIDPLTWHDLGTSNVDINIVAPQNASVAVVLNSSGSYQSGASYYIGQYSTAGLIHMKSSPTSSPANPSAPAMEIYLEGTGEPYMLSYHTVLSLPTQLNLNWMLMQGDYSRQISNLNISEKIKSPYAFSVSQSPSIESLPDSLSGPLFLVKSSSGMSLIQTKYELSTVWEKALTESEIEFYSAQSTKESETLVLGAKWHYLSSANPIELRWECTLLLRKLDTSGNIVWEKRFPDEHFFGESCTRPNGDPDWTPMRIWPLSNGYLISFAPSFTQNWKKSGYGKNFLKVDSNGNRVWSISVK